MEAQIVSSYPEVRRVMNELGLRVHQLLEDGPRYVVASIDYRNKPALFKMVVPHANNPIPPEDTGTWHPSLLDDTLKEIALLDFLSKHRERVAGRVPLLLDDGTVSGSAWYIRELLRGAPMAEPTSPFIFPDRFYEQVPPEQVAAYFKSLHELAPKVPDELAARMQLWYPRTEHIKLLAAALDGDWSHPVVRQLAGRLGPWLEANEPGLRDAGRVIAHNEPYASHVFLEDGQIGLIDWESSSWGHPLHDFSRLWVRFFDHDDYRTRFEHELARAGYFEGSGAVDWDLTRIVQGVASLNYYFNNHVLPAKKEQKLYSVLAQAIAEIAERRM